jgi:peptidoglycan hydrolase-like protein with peptidoglycan-binding domain
MFKGVDGGTTAPIPQDSSIDQQQTAQSSEPVQTQQQDSAETLKGAQSNATERAAESSITGRLLASQLQVQLDSKPVGAPEIPSDKKPLLVKDGNNNPADVKDIQHQLNEARGRDGQDPIKEDGIFGKNTKAAVEEFQEKSGLKKDGIIGPNTRDRLTLENNSTFQKLDPDVQNQIRDRMNASQKNPTQRQDTLALGTDENFAKLKTDQQKTMLLNNEDFLKKAETPEGKKELDGIKAQLQAGPQTPATLKQLERINSATFTPAAGTLVLKGSAADQATYLHMVRRDMLASPSFAKTMNDINTDVLHPVTVNIGRDMPDVRLDVDRGNGDQDVDLADLEKLPALPTAQDPNGITQGEVLSHAMKEAQIRAQNPNSNAPEPDQHLKAHTAAIKQENDFRKDLGQTTFRKLPPNDEAHLDNSKKDITIRIFFNGPPGKQDLVFDEEQKLVTP